MKAVLFDVDGTLVESMAVDTAIYFDAIQSVLGTVDIRERLSDYEHVTDMGILGQILDDNRLSRDADVMREIETGFVARIEDHIRSTGPFPAIDGAVGMLERCKQAPDTRVAIATGGWRQSASAKLRSAGFDLDGVPLASSNDAASRIEIMRIALARIGTGMDSVVYFGDAEWDRRACAELGWDFVAVGPELDGILSFDGLQA